MFMHSYLYLYTQHGFKDCSMMRITAYIALITKELLK